MNNTRLETFVTLGNISSTFLVLFPMEEFAQVYKMRAWDIVTR